MKLPFLFFFIFMLSCIAVASAFDFSTSDKISDIGIAKKNSCVDMYQYCSNCSYVNVTAIKYPNATIQLAQFSMTPSSNDYTYKFCSTDILGDYFYTTCGTKSGLQVCEEIYFKITSTGSNGSMFFIIFIFGFAVIFFVSTLFVDEEFFVYISGVLFLVAGIYVMINGIDVINDWYTRTISYISLGLGMLFTVGAYVFNKYYKYSENEEEYD